MNKKTELRMEELNEVVGGSFWTWLKAMFFRKQKLRM